MPNKKHADASEVGKRLRELLKKNGIARHGAGARLARQYGVDTVTANAWINGDHRPSIENARRLADDLGSTVEFLLFGGRFNHVEPVGIATSPTMGKPSAGSVPSEQQISSMAQSLTAEQLSAFIDIAIADLSAADQIQIAQRLLDSAHKKLPASD